MGFEKPDNKPPQNMFDNLSIRTKIMLAQVLMIALVSMFIYSYYPQQQQSTAVKAIQSEIFSISNMFSIGVGIGMGETDFVAVSEALEWANSDSSVVYVSVLNLDNQPILDFNRLEELPTELAGIEIGASPQELDGTIFYRTSILYQDMPFGSITIGYSLAQMHASIGKLKTTTLYFCITLFACGVLLAFLISNMITRAIRQLDVTVRTISSGTENVRVDVSSNDEVGKLGRAFNHMLHRLDKSRNELIAYSEQLKKQNEELNRFSYVVSHDLKAPLRAIFKLSEWIEEDLGNVMPPETKKNMQTLRGRVFRLEALINGLLQYSKIGRVNVPIERLDVQQMLRDTVELLNPPSHIKIHVQQGMPVFQTKRILLQQVFTNLISNAIKYNDKPEGVVRIEVQDTGAFYQFSVKDNGIGIGKEYHEKVFEIFRTLNARDKVESTGVGLSITKKSVEDMGGEIRLESEDNIGANFIFTWPKAA